MPERIRIDREEFIRIAAELSGLALSDFEASKLLSETRITGEHEKYGRVMLTRDADRFFVEAEHTRLIRPSGS